MNSTRLFCRRQMESAKLMVEAKLQETGQQLMECERQLTSAIARRAAVAAPKDVTNGGASAFATDSPRRDGSGDAAAESPGTPPSDARRSGHPFFNSLLETEVTSQIPFWADFPSHFAISFQIIPDGCPACTPPSEKETRTILFEDMSHCPVTPAARGTPSSIACWRQR